MSSDIKKPWLNVARRLQSAVRLHECPAVLQISVLLDSNGLPIVWSKPAITELEPESCCIEQLLALLTTGAIGGIMNVDNINNREVDDNDGN